MEEKKLLTIEFFDKKCTTVAVPHLLEDLMKIDEDILKCNEKIEAAGLAGVSYTSKSSQICEGCDQLGKMNAYVDSAHAQVSDGLDWPLWLNFKSGATETISRIKVEDISTENNIGLEEHAKLSSYDVSGYSKQVKSKLTFEDFVELDSGELDVRIPLTEVGGMKTFRSLFHLEYVKVKEQMPDVDNPREYMKELLVWGQEDHKGYHPVKDFFSGLADLIFIVPLIEMCIGYDFITEEDLSEQDMTMKGVSVVTGVISLGLALKMVQGVNLLSKTGLQVGAKAVALDLTSSAVGYTVGDLSNRLGLPLPITLILSGGATAGTFKVASKHVFSDADSIVKVLNGRSKAERNLKFSLEGSSNLDDLAYQRYWNDVASGGHLPPGMTAEEYTKYIKGLNKLDDINALNRVDYDEILKLRKGSSKTYSGDLMSPQDAARYDELWRNQGIGSDKTWEGFKNANPESSIDDYFKLVKEQSPWPQGYNPMDNITTLKEGDRFYMVLDNGQKVTQPGGFAILDEVPNVEFARNDMAIKSNWKKDCGIVVQYEIKSGMELNAPSGPIGPQIDLNVDKYLPGNMSATQYDLFNGLGHINRNDFIQYVPGTLKKIQ